MPCWRIKTQIIRAAADAPVESRADLLSLGRLQLAPMLQGKTVRTIIPGWDQAGRGLLIWLNCGGLVADADQPGSIARRFRSGTRRR